MLSLLTQHKIKSLLFSLITGLVVVFSNAPVFAASSAPPPNINLSSLGQCPDGLTQYSTEMSTTPPSGELYVRLSNTQESTSKVSVYFQSLENGVCSLVGSATAQYGQWTNVGRFSVSSNNGGFMIVSGNGLGAYPYSSSAKVLILRSNICNLVSSCNVNYQGYQASIEPNILSKATDQVVVYDISSVSGVGYSKVSYYTNGQYLYGGTVLKPVDRNYLSGGINNTDIQIAFKDGQVLDINQQINMGPDYSGELAVKSWFYRSSDKFLIISISIAVFLLLWVLLFTVRYFYKKHRDKVHHGLDNSDLGDSNQPPPPTPPKIIIG